MGESGKIGKESKSIHPSRVILNIQDRKLSTGEEKGWRGDGV